MPPVAGVLAERLAESLPPGDGHRHAGFALIGAVIVAARAGEQFQPIRQIGQAPLRLGGVRLVERLQTIQPGGRELFYGRIQRRARPRGMQRMGEEGEAARRVDGGDGMFGARRAVEHAMQRHALRIEAVGQQVNLLPLERGDQFQPGDLGDAVAQGRLVECLESSEGLVVGERGVLHAGLGQQFDHIRRCVVAVAGIGVAVQVDQHGIAPFGAGQLVVIGHPISPVLG